MDTLSLNCPARTFTAFAWTANRVSIVIAPLSYPDSHVILICFAVDSPDSLDNVQEKVRHNPFPFLAICIFVAFCVCAYAARAGPSISYTAINQFVQAKC